MPFIVPNNSGCLGRSVIKKHTGVASQFCVQAGVIGKSLYSMFSPKRRYGQKRNIINFTGRSWGLGIKPNSEKQFIPRQETLLDLKHRYEVTDSSISLD